MENLSIWEKVRTVPPTAQKPIVGGRLKGKSDINPVWRLKTLTEQFGVCGVGWKYVIKKSWLEPGANSEIAAFVEIEIYIKADGQWSEAIPGTGGSSFVAKESGGLYVSDECFKMALTDAISVACKALGVGADVYWEKDSSKYDKPQGEPPQSKPAVQSKPQSKPEPPQKDDSGALEKASKAQVVNVFKSGAEKKVQLSEFDIFKLLEELLQKGSITTKYPYADKEKTIINWTQLDVSRIMEDLELPF